MGQVEVGGRLGQEPSPAQARDKQPGEPFVQAGGPGWLGRLLPGGGAGGRWDGEDRRSQRGGTVGTCQRGVESQLHPHQGWV